MSNHRAEEKGGDSFSVVHTQSDIIIIIIIEKRALEQTQRQREQIPRRNLPRSNRTKSNAFNLTATRTEPNASRTPFPSRRINARVDTVKKNLPKWQKGKKHLSATTYRSLQQLVVVLAGASDDVGSFGDGRLGDDNLRPEKSGLGECRHYSYLFVCV